MAKPLIRNVLIDDDLRAGCGRMRGEARVWRRLMGGRASSSLGAARGSGANRSPAKFAGGSGAGWGGGGSRGQGGDARPTSVVVKNISSIRTRASAARVIRYIGRLDGEAYQLEEVDEVGGGEAEMRRVRRADREPLMRDGGGNVVDRASVVANVLKEWRLDDDANLTNAARIVDAMADGAKLVAVAAAPRKRRKKEGVAAPESIRLVDDEGGESVDRRLVARLERAGVIEEIDAAADAGGEIVAGGDKLEDEVRRWRRIGDLRQEDRYRDVRIRHVMMTVPLPEDKDRRLVEAAVARTVAQTFEAWRFPSVRATHREHGKHIHVHVAVRADNDVGDRLTLDDRVCDLLRMTLADNARALGLAADWTRRIDRPEVTDAVLRGTATLDEDRNRADYRDGLDTVPKEFREMIRLERRCPQWFETHGGDFIHRDRKARLEARLERLPGLGLPADLAGEVQVADDAPAGGGLLARLLGRRGAGSAADAAAVPVEWPIPAYLEKIADRLRRRRVFERPDRALLSFEAMHREDSALAGWYLRHRPEVFGPVDAGAARHLAEDCGLKWLVAELRRERRRSSPEATATTKDGRRLFGPASRPAGLAVPSISAGACAQAGLAGDLVKVVRGHERLAADIERITPLADERLPQEERIRAKETAMALRDRAAQFVERLVEEQVVGAGGAGDGGIGRAVAARVAMLQTALGPMVRSSSGGGGGRGVGEPRPRPTPSRDGGEER